MVSKKEKEPHELVELRACAFGDGGFYYHDGADRAICSCGWESTAVQRDKTALVALWKAHCESAQFETQCPKCKHKFVVAENSKDSSKQKRQLTSAVR